MELAGVRIWLFRPQKRAQKWMEELKLLGAFPLSLPTIELVPSLRAILQLNEEFVRRYEALFFTSVEAVESTLPMSAPTIRKYRIALFGSGPSLKEGVESHGLSMKTPQEEGGAKALAALLREEEEPKRALFLQGSCALPTLPTLLQGSGWNIDFLTVYETKHLFPQEIPLQKGDYLLFSSPSQLMGFFAAAPFFTGCHLFALGETTAAALAKRVNQPVHWPKSNLWVDLRRLLIAFNLGLPPIQRMRSVQ